MCFLLAACLAWSGPRQARRAQDLWGAAHACCCRFTRQLVAAFVVAVLVGSDGLSAWAAHRHVGTWARLYERDVVVDRRYACAGLVLT